MTISVIIGYLFSVGCNIFFLKKLIKSLWINANIRRLERYNAQTLRLGIVDSTFYYLIFHLFLNQIYKDSYQLLLFLGGWITIKSLSSIWQNKASQQYYVINPKRIEGTGGERYNIYLTGTLLNILISLSGAYLSYLLNLTSHSGFFLTRIPDDIAPLGILFSIPIFIYILTTTIDLDPKDDNKEFLKKYKVKNEF